MDDDLKFIIEVGIGITLLIVGVVCGVVVGWNSTFVGQRYDVVVTVQAVEHSTRWGEHTNVWVRVYGDQDITYCLVGRVEMEIGKTYRIIFVNQYAVYGFEVWGNVASIEEVNATQGI